MTERGRLGPDFCSSHEQSFPFCRGSTDPFRLYNLDVFEYEVDSNMALYGAVPYMVAHR